jgi:hypothetical protein
MAKLLGHKNSKFKKVMRSSNIFIVVLSFKLFAYFAETRHTDLARYLSATCTEISYGADTLADKFYL